MSITTEKKSVGGVGRGGLVAIIAGGVTGMGMVGFLLYKTFKPAKTAAARQQSAGEARISAKAEATRNQAEAGAGKMRQEEVGSGYEFDAQGNYLPPKVDSRDIPDNQPLVSLDTGQGDARARIAAGIHEEAAPRSARPERESAADTDPNMARERREAKKEDRQDLQGSMLGYTTSPSATWAARHASREARGTREEASQSPEEAQIKANNQSIERLTAIAEKAMGGGQAEAAPGPKMPAETASQLAPEGEVADMRISGGAAPNVLVREGKFLDCVMINRLESDISESPVMAQVARDFVSLDGKQVLIPAGSKLYGTAGRVENLQQARLFIKFHKLVFPRRTPEETPKVAYFPTRRFPAMDSLGSLGVKDKVNRHMMLQFGAAIFLGVFDGLAAQVQSATADDNPTARDLVLSRTSQNFSNVVNAVIQRYANVVPTVTIREGTKLKCYFTQDVMLTPFMATRDLSWVRGK